MNYITNYYKNLSEQLQERINILQKQLDEAFVRSPTEQTKAGLETLYKNINPKRKPYRKAPDTANRRIDQMLHFQAAHAIAHPHEREAIESILTDMANSKPGDTFVGEQTPEERERIRKTGAILTGIQKQRKQQGISYHPNDWEGQDPEYRRAQHAFDSAWTALAGSAREAESAAVLRTALGAVKRLKGTEQFEKSLGDIKSSIDVAADAAVKKHLKDREGEPVDPQTQAFRDRGGDLQDLWDDATFRAGEDLILGPRKKK